MIHRNTLSILIALAALSASAATSWAHPHVFIVQRIQVMFDDDGLAGVKIRWKFDDMFASMISEDYDRNRNGQLEPGEVDLVKENAFSNLSQFSYFTFIKINDQPFEVKFIKDFDARLTANRLEYEFFIPCHVKATDRAKKIAVATYDPTYYSAIYFAKNAPVSLDSADAFDVKTSIQEDPDKAIYYGMIHPWTLFLEFRWKS